MLSRGLSTGFRRSASLSGRQFHASSKAAIKVAIVGASGGIGQPLSMLFKLDYGVNQLNIHDIKHTPGVGADLSHIPTQAKIFAYKGEEQLEDCLDGMDFVVVAAGAPRSPGQARDDLFEANAGVIKKVAQTCAKAAPNAAYLILTNPINSMVPMFAQVLKNAGTYNPKKLFGVTTLDITHANCYVSDAMNWNSLETNVNVVGGHDHSTMIPLLSQVRGATFSDKDVHELTHRIRYASDEVVKAKEGAGSSTLSMVYAGYKFGSQVVNAFRGQLGIVECAFVENSLTPAPFFSAPVTLGTKGVEWVHEIEPLSSYEKELLDKAVPDLIAQAEKGVEFANRS